MFPYEKGDLDTFCTSPRTGAALLSASSLIPKKRMPFGVLFFGASVLIGLFKKERHTNTFLFSDIFKFNPHPYRMWIEFEGLSHELR